MYRTTLCPQCQKKKYNFTELERSKLYFQQNYITTEHKYTWKCDTCGQAFTRSLANFRSSKKQKVQCNACQCREQNLNKAKFKEEEIMHLAFSQEYINNNTLYSWICINCSNIFTKSTGNIRTCKHFLCKNCSINKRKIKFSDEDLKHLAYPLEYINSNTKYKWICESCKEIYEQNNMSKNYFCSKCAQKISHKGKCLSGFSEEELKHIIPNQKYIGNHNHYKWECEECGNIFVRSPMQIRDPKVKFPFKCSRCYNKSSGEIYISKLLDDINLEYNHLLKIFYNNHKHIYDFYIPSKNIYIEYDGAQHFCPVDFSGRGKQWAQEQFNIRQIRDAEKDMWCFINGYELIRIPYTMSDEDIEKLLTERLCD